MRRFAAALLLALPAAAQTPPGGYDPATGARPGNEIGTGMSLPRSITASNLNEATTHSDLAPNLPAPAADSIASLLVTARQALIAGQTGAAQEALERAETRMLDRSIPAGTESVADDRHRVALLSQARQALAAGDLHRTVADVDAVMAREAP